jgi:PIN domain nuclease of toxin-antitoxin system
VILLDTHVWIWWVHDEAELTEECRDLLQAHESDGLGLSAISCWEVAKLVQRNRLILPVRLEDWMDQALAYPGIQLLDLDPRVAVESVQLPGDFHQDPADQIIVATARLHNVPLVTADKLILKYPHVQTISAR